MTTAPKLRAGPWHAIAQQFIFGMPNFRANLREPCPGARCNIERLASSRIPLLILIPRDETGQDGPRTADRYREQLPHARVELVDDSNHIVFIDRTDVVNGSASEVPRRVMTETSRRSKNWSDDHVLVRRPAASYHGPRSPGGVAMAFKVIQRAFDRAVPRRTAQRRSVVVRTAFRGPGARDGFEAVTRAVTDGRYTVDRSAGAGPIAADCSRISCSKYSIGETSVTCCCATDSSPTSSSIWPARKIAPHEQERRLDELKAQLAQRSWPHRPPRSYRHRWHLPTYQRQIRQRRRADIGERHCPAPLFR